MSAERRACRGCNRPLIFAPTEDGKVVPLDTVAPTYRLARDLTGHEIAEPAEQVYVSHFATCPKADQFSKSKRGAHG